MPDEAICCPRFDPRPWQEKEVPDAENVKISGKFLTKVFDGPYKEMRNFFKEMEAYVNRAGHEKPKYYVYYTTCPKCAEKHGHNNIVFFAQVSESPSRGEERAKGGALASDAAPV